MNKFYFLTALTACILLGVFFTPAPTAIHVYYVSPTGSDANPGTITQPFRTWQKLTTVMSKGDTAYIRGGTYTTTQSASASVHCLWENMNGTSADSFFIKNYPGESPVLDLSNINPANNDPTILIIRNCSYLHVEGLRVTGLKQRSNGAGVSRAIDLQGTSHSLFSRIEADHIGGYGFILSDDSNDNYFLNCDAHHMDDRLTTDGGAWGNANGFQCTGGSTATRNTFDGCRAWWISDDGFDLYGTSGTFTFKNCWAFWNGNEPGTFTKRGDGDGFKLGPHKAGAASNSTIIRDLRNCLSFENRRAGFDQNDGDIGTRMYNCGSFKNDKKGYQWGYVSPAPTCDFKNNWAYQNGEEAQTGSEITGTTNSWTIPGLTIVNADFMSVSSAGADGPRKADGSLPDLNFLKPSAGSKLINAGTIISGMPYVSTAPDLGPFEFSSTTVPTIKTFSFEWIKSTARKRDIQINWSGMPVIGSKSFEIQRKGKSFAKIGSVTPLQGIKEYTYLDVPPVNGTYTYRIRHLDETGSEIFSTTSKISFKKGASAIASVRSL
jgi:hypothetical protein